jgi:hypothetical protein
MNPTAVLIPILLLEFPPLLRLSRENELEQHLLVKAGLGVVVRGVSQTVTGAGQDLLDM